MRCVVLQGSMSSMGVPLMGMPEEDEEEEEEEGEGEVQVSSLEADAAQSEQTAASQLLPIRAEGMGVDVTAPAAAAVTSTSAPAPPSGLDTSPAPVAPIMIPAGPAEPVQEPATSHPAPLSTQAPEQQAAVRLEQAVQAADSAAADGARARPIPPSAFASQVPFQVQAAGQSGVPMGQSGLMQMVQAGAGSGSGGGSANGGGAVTSLVPGPGALPGATYMYVPMYVLVPVAGTGAGGPAAGTMSGGAPNVDASGTPLTAAAPGAVAGAGGMAGAAGGQAPTALTGFPFLPAHMPFLHPSLAGAGQQYFTLAHSGMLPGMVGAPGMTAGNMGMVPGMGQGTVGMPEVGLAQPGGAPGAQGQTAGGQAGVSSTGGAAGSSTAAGPQRGAALSRMLLGRIGVGGVAGGGRSWRPRGVLERSSARLGVSSIDRYNNLGAASIPLQDFLPQGQ